MPAEKVLETRWRFSRKSSMRILASAVAPMLAIPALAHASPAPYIGVQFTYNYTLAPSSVAGVFPQDYYNTAACNAEVTNKALVDDNGTATAITLSDIIGGGGGVFSPGSTLTNNEILSSGSSNSVNAGGSASYTLNNVPAGTYGLVAYIVSSNGTPKGIYYVGGTTYSTGTQSGSAFVSTSDTWIQATNTTAGTYPVSNYVEFDNITVPSGGGSITLGDTVVTGFQSLPVDGLQMLIESPTPEPASAVIIGAGCVGLAMKRHRRL